MTREIKIPKLDPELFEIVGYDHHKCEWTDEQLGEHIAVLECATRYFMGRNDALMIYRQLLREYDTLLSYKESRERG